MEIIAIIAKKDSITFELNESLENRQVIIREFVPLLEEEFITDTDKEMIHYENKRIIIPRFIKQRDRICSRFELWLEKERLEGGCYDTDLEEVAPRTYEYPKLETIKALGCEGEDMQILGIKQGHVNINLPAMLTLNPAGEDIPFECNGTTYYFKKERVEELDQYMISTYSYGAVVTAILLNAPKLFDSNKEEALLKKVIHPGYDWNSKSTYISAFPMQTSEGQEFYKAFVEFLAERYTREDAKYGRMCGMIISNEVNSQYIWGNAGEMPVSEYSKEYTTAMRLAWLSARKYYKNFRIYVSLDHLWNLTFDTQYPNRYYKGRDIIDFINHYSKTEGDFDWNVAYHPYPENLMYPDFYNDRSTTFDFSTLRITFKNIEMLPAYLSQKNYLYRGCPRRIILSEQGFNSKGDSFSEKQGAAAYCLAYQKVKKEDTIDMMTHHAYVDNPYEFGLNLGIRRRNEDGSIGEPKPIYYVMRDMDTEFEEQRVAEARSFIGEELFDALLNPSITYGEPDNSKASEFQESNVEDDGITR